MQIMTVIWLYYVWHKDKFQLIFVRQGNTFALPFFFFP